MINILYLDDEIKTDRDSVDIFKMNIDGVYGDYNLYLYNDFNQFIKEVLNFGNNTIIILDIRMPVKNGADVLKELRELKLTFPVIGYSANKDDENNDLLIKLLENDLYSYVKKNDHEKLVEVINNAIEKFKDNIPLELTEALNEYLERHSDIKESKIIIKESNSTKEISFSEIQNEINKGSTFGKDYQKALYKIAFEYLKK